MSLYQRLRKTNEEERKTKKIRLNLVYRYLKAPTQFSD